MKKFSLLFSAILMSLAMLAQTPQGINYQTVIRDGDGNILPDTELTLQMTIRTGAPDGEVVYAETHAVTTNAFGLVNLVIGRGTPLSGGFGAVEWGKNSHYLETAIEIAGSKQFQVMGVTQFLSVPYAQFSGYTGSLLTMTTQERNALPDPPVGMQIYNVTTNCLNYYNGAEWFEACGNQVENFPPDVPVYYMPPDGAMDMPLEVWFQWSCSDPEGDPLLYDFYLGTNNPPPLDFTTDGTAWGSYPLAHSSTYFWRVVARDDHDNATEGPLWSFQTINCFPPEVYAGGDTIICENESFQVAGATIGTSATLVGWTSSGDGTFSDPLALNPTYTPGALDIANGMVWLTLSAASIPPCPPIQASDEMILSFELLPTVYTGEDATVCFGDPIPLNAIAQNYSVSLWHTTNGHGYIENQYQLNATYIPSYMDLFLDYIEFGIFVLPALDCNQSASDWLNITLVESPEADAGPDQLNLPGTTATLAGNTPPAGGSGVWSINSGGGGSIAQPNNPASTFTGVAGVSYVLIWEVESEYGCYANDDVTISFASGFVCGNSTVTDADGNVYNTVQIGSQCWMKQNLKTTKYRNGTNITYPGSNNTAWQNNTTGAYAWYNNDIAYKNTYGALYNWHAVNNSTGLCPTGWHVPTDAQWTTLTTYVSSQPAYLCNSNTSYIAKALAAKTNWNSATCTCCIGNNLNTNNATNFTALPGGDRGTGGTFYYIRYIGNWWSSTEYSTADAWTRHLTYYYALVYRYYYSKGLGFSVRCLRD